MTMSGNVALELSLRQMIETARAGGAVQTGEIVKHVHRRLLDCDRSELIRMLLGALPTIVTAHIQGHRTPQVVMAQIQALTEEAEAPAVPVPRSGHQAAPSNKSLRLRRAAVEAILAKEFSGVAERKPLRQFTLDDWLARRSDLAAQRFALQAHERAAELIIREMRRSNAHRFDQLAPDFILRVWPD